MDRTRKDTVRIADLFAGMGGIRLGAEQALNGAGYRAECVFTSEIKPHAVSVLLQNHPRERVTGDITRVNPGEIPDFDLLCAGFPCQPFSAAGKGLGFDDDRGEMFFHIARILRAKRPAGFLLENVEGLVRHDRGRTLAVILRILREELGYEVTYKTLNAARFGVPQDRKRVYIAGTRDGASVNLDGMAESRATLGDILEQGKPTARTPFVDKLLSHYTARGLEGKSIKDKRGGEGNIHSWDIETKGAVTPAEKALLNRMLTERRKRKWAARLGVDWMDGMPLTEEMIGEFCDDPGLHAMLGRLTAAGYLVLEHPKRLVRDAGRASSSTRREPDTSRPKGYNIVTGKLSFPVSKVLAPWETAPTLVAMDAAKLYVRDGEGIRNLTPHEGLRLFGYPEDYRLDVPEREAFDLLGNTVVVPVIRAVAERLIKAMGL